MMTGGNQEGQGRDVLQGGIGDYPVGDRYGCRLLILSVLMRVMLMFALCCPARSADPREFAGWLFVDFFDNARPLL